MSDVLADLEAMFAGMSPDEKANADKLIEAELKRLWLPSPGPQSDAYYSNADVLLFGGSAGSGKSSLLIGLALTSHKRPVIYRRAYVDIRGLEDELFKCVGGRDGYNAQDKIYRGNDCVLRFGALEKPGAEFSAQGVAADYIGYDEGAQVSESKVRFTMGWLRSDIPGQRCRVVIASNPPMGGEGEWLISWFAPWLDPMFPNPAKSGELRWCVMLDDRTEWVDGPGRYEFDGKSITAMSRTFIPGKLADNPYLKDSGYRERLENLPEPLRSQLLEGNFLAGREDHEWQVIPTEWVRLANERWRNAPEKRRRMIALAADVAGTGGDDNCLARLHEDAWFDEPVNFKGAEIVGPGEDALIPSRIADKMLAYRKDGADMSVDGTGGWGSGVRSRLSEDHKIDCASVVFSAGSVAKNKDKTLGFHNLRAEMYWRFREALDPDTGDDIALPPDKRLIAELTIPRYKIKGTNILIEAKDEIKKRAGSSPDRADAYVIAWHRRIAAHREAQRKERAAKSPIKLKMQQRPSPTGWMG